MQASCSKQGRVGFGMGGMGREEFLISENYQTPTGRDGAYLAALSDSLSVIRTAVSGAEQGGSDWLSVNITSSHRLRTDHFLQVAVIQTACEPCPDIHILAALLINKAKGPPQGPTWALCSSGCRTQQPSGVGAACTTAPTDLH
ncbi:hypothetical protein PAMA_014198 [Pampus argenteus]